MPLNLRPFPRDYLPLGIAIEPKSADDREKLAQELQRIAAEDGRVRISMDEESGQTRLEAADEKHVEAVAEALRGAGIVINTGAPQIGYREILSSPVEADYTHEKHTGPSYQFARVKMRFEPNARTMSNTFASAIEGGSVPSEFVPAVERGFRAVCASGPLVGFPVVACHATLLDGAYHDTDSSPLAFEIAARAAFREAGPRAAIKLLEPYLEIDISTPQEFLGSVVGDFKSRRGVCNTKEASPGVAAIYGFAPLANMLGYAASLKAMTRSAATYSWKLAGLEDAPMEGGDAPFPMAAAKRS